MRVSLDTVDSGHRAAPEGASTTPEYIGATGGTGGSAIHAGTRKGSHIFGFTILRRDAGSQARERREMAESMRGSVAGISHWNWYRLGLSDKYLHRTQTKGRIRI